MAQRSIVIVWGEGREQLVNDILLSDARNVLVVGPEDDLEDLLRAERLELVILDTTMDESLWKSMLQHFVTAPCRPHVYLACAEATLPAALDVLANGEADRIIPREAPWSCMGLGSDGLDSVGSHRSAICSRVIVDLGERCRQLRSEIDRLRRLSDLKSEFLSNVSHELRTPLSVIIGYNEILLRQLAGSISERQLGYLEHTRRNASHLLSLISNLLDLSKIEAGKIDVSVDLFTLSELVEDLRHVLGGLLVDHEVTAEVRAEGEQFILSTNYKKVRQIAINLLSNAVKFTPAGHIEVRAHLDGDTLELLVSDTGRGISAADCEKLFEVFSQVGEAQVGGTGLGLAIAKKLTTMLGGTIEVDSTPGKGSTFTVRLPAQLDPATGSDEEVWERYERLEPERTVVVLDDDPTGPEMIRTVADQLGLEMVHHRDGREFLQVLHRFRPLVVFADLGMEFPTFKSMLKLLRGENLEVVALAADEGQANSLGKSTVREVLLRPLDFYQVRRILLQSIGGDVSVLLVDDDQRIIKAYSRILFRLGYRVHLAYNGLDAKEILERHSVDLVCVDIMMPRISGFELIRTLREDERFKELPVIAITGKHLEAEELDFLQRSGVEWLDKGDFNTAAYESAVVRALDKRQEDG